MENNLNDETPGLAFIEVPSEDPFVFFNKWYQEVQQTDLPMPQAFTLATADGDAKVSARSLILKRVDAEGFVFASDRRSRKAQNLADVPNAAMVFLWVYRKNEDIVIRQVRVEGRVTEMTLEENLALYDADLLYCKMRSHICPQGKQVEWQELQDSYENLLGKIEEGQPLPMPDHFTGYKLRADVMEFYYTVSNKIADRVVFQKDSDGTSWKHFKIAA